MHILPFTRKEIEFFKELNKAKVPHIIVGLSAAAMQGAPLVTKDVDIWFKNLNDPKLQKVLKKCKITFIPTINMNPPIITGTGIELIDIVTHVHGVEDFDNVYKKCVKIKVADVAFRVLSLRDIIRSKESLNRKKDSLVLPVLRDTLIVQKSKKR
ncbi:hypothetical protein ACFLQ8_02115 [Candidatus Auribacterota bacterium]